MHNMHEKEFWKSFGMNVIDGLMAHDVKALSGLLFWFRQKEVKDKTDPWLLPRPLKVKKAFSFHGRVKSFMGMGNAISDEHFNEQAMERIKKG